MGAATSDASDSAIERQSRVPEPLVLAQLLIGTPLLHLVKENKTELMNSITATDCKNDNDICFLKELSHAIGLILDRMQRHCAPEFSDSPSSVWVSLNDIIVKLKDKQILQRMITMDKDMLAGESSKTENDLPASLVALNKEFGLSKVEGLMLNYAIFRFDQFIDPYEVCRQYMLRASDLVESAETNGFIGGGDRLFYIPNKKLFQIPIRTLDYETVTNYNNMLVNSGTKSVKNEISKQAADKDNRQWYFIASHGWGDCLAGCIYRRNFLFVYDRKHKKASLVATSGDSKWKNFFTCGLGKLF